MKEQSNKQVCRASGFTLIELLTVIAVVAILAGLLIPAVNRVRVTARQTVCASNMRQIGLALHMFANDHNGRLPGTAHFSENESWIFTLAPYLDDVDEIRISPGDPRRDERLVERNSTSYVMNDLIFIQATDFRGRPVGPDRSNLHAMRDPSGVILGFTGSERRGHAPTEDHTHASGWANNWRGFLNDVSPDLHRTRDTEDRTNGAANYLYADGRIETKPASEVRGKIESGVNIALPPNER
ncbi:MAG: DUF1559 domain-containing protein [Opitutales bacterium]|nr:DUF1559 domain-containing protein [Opitutales bacterium]MCH8540992.1 DUF1559 domain-containing protein [Opitutales bacterium]